MNIFSYYTGAFKKFKDYQGIATRKEFNFLFDALLEKEKNNCL